jgi:hypothetical protein
MFKFTIREAILMTTIVAILLMWWLERSQNAKNDARLTAIEARLHGMPTVLLPPMTFSNLSPPPATFSNLPPPPPKRREQSFSARECLSMSSSAADPRRTSSARFGKCLSPAILRSFALAVSDASEAKGA